ncbi:MAG: TVP38/TMEM64 family protein [Nocardioides sp.]
MSRGTVVRLGVLAALVVGAIVLQLVVGLPSQDDLRSALDDLGGWAIPVFVLVYVGVCLLPAGPTALVTIVGGALLGFATGLAAVLVGANLGALAAFTVSRYLGRDAVVKISNDRVRSLDEQVRQHGFSTVLVARLVPLVPFSTANYVFGLTSVKLRDFVVATVFGIVPGTAVYVAVGAFGTEPGSLPFLLAIGGLVLLSLIGLARKRFSRDRSGGPTRDEPAPESASGG